MYKKFQTTVPINGEVTGARKLGFVEATDLDADMEEVRKRFSDLAQHGIDIQAVELTDTTVVAVYKSGVVRIVHWTL